MNIPTNITLVGLYLLLVLCFHFSIFCNIIENKYRKITHKIIDILARTIILFGITVLFMAYTHIIISIGEYIYKLIP